MDQQDLRAIMALITLATGLWMAGYSIFLRSKGVKVAAVAQRSTNWPQRLLIAGGLLLDLYLVLRAPFPVLDEFLRALPSPSPIIAVAVTAAGALIVAASQLGMGRSWRVGVPEETGHVDELVTTGLHRFSRNPVYFGIMVFLSGALLAAPGPFTAFAVVISYFGLTMIIRQEERYLRDRFGDRYDDYARRVRRWI